MAVTRRTRKLLGALGFLAFGLAASAIGPETRVGTLLFAPGIASWFVFAQATLADVAAKRAAEPRELRGIPRVKVARALMASSFIPGTGHLVLGWSRTRAFLFALPFLAAVGAAAAGLIPAWAGAVLAGLPYLTAQAELRYRTGWGLSRQPDIGDVFPPDPNEPNAFADADKLASDDPRRGWRGRT